MEMNQQKLHYLIWFAKAYAKKLSLVGLFGLFLVLASLVFYATKVLEVKRNIQQVKVEQLAQSKINHSTRLQSDADLPQNAAEEAAKFYSRFPTLEALPKILNELNNIAVNQGIAIDIGDYKYDAVKSLHTVNQRSSNQPPASKNALNQNSGTPRDLSKYEIIFPITGKYSQIRAFIAESLQKFPEIALLELQIVRNESTSVQVEANLSLAIYVKGAK